MSCEAGGTLPSLNDLRQFMEEQFDMYCKGKKMPESLVWILFGDAVCAKIMSRYKVFDRKSCYRSLFRYLRFACGIGVGAHTLVFPEVLKMIVRVRFPGPTSNYADPPMTSGVHNVSIKEMAELSV